MVPDSTMIETTTTSELKASRRARRSRTYMFMLTEDQMLAAAGKKLPAAAFLALAAISGAAFGCRKAQWVTLSARTQACLPHDYRWWHRATTALCRAGLVECQRHPGRLPRYRLLCDAHGAGRPGRGA